MDYEENQECTCSSENGSPDILHIKGTSRQPGLHNFIHDIADHNKNDYAFSPYAIRIQDCKHKEDLRHDTEEIADGVCQPKVI